MNEIAEKTEVLARAWIACDPNRGGTDPDPSRYLRSDGNNKGWAIGFATAAFIPSGPSPFRSRRFAFQSAIT